MPFISLLPRYSVYTLLIFAPLARGAVQPWAITVIQMITLIGLTAFLITKTWEGNLHWIKTPLDKPIVLLLALCTISLIFSVHRPTSIRSLILLINYLIVFYLTIHTFRTRRDILHLVYVIIGVSLFLSLFGLFKYLGTNPFPWWDYTDLPALTHRLSSTYGNPDHLAGFMEMALPLLLGLLLLGYTRGQTVLFLYITCMVLSALILSLSRGAWLATAAGLIFMAVGLLFDRHFHRKRLIIGITGTTILALFIILSTTPVVERIIETTAKDTESNLYSRILGWQGTIDMIGEHPLTGTGPGTYRYAFTKYQPPGLAAHRTMAHNDYLHFIAEIGIVLAAAIVISLIAVFAKGLNKLKNPSRLVRGTTLGALAGVTAMIFHSFFDFNLHIPGNTVLFTALLAISITLFPTSYRPAS